MVATLQTAAAHTRSYAFNTTADFDTARQIKVHLLPGDREALP